MIKLRRSNQKEYIALKELKAMLPFFLTADGLVLVIVGLYVFMGGEFGFDIIVGLILGNIASAVNFYIMAVIAEKIIRAHTGQKPKRAVALGYGMRYVILFIIFGILITIGLINPITAALPLLYPSTYYKLKAMFNKSV